MHGLNPIVETAFNVNFSIQPSRDAVAGKHVDFEVGAFEDIDGFADYAELFPGSTPKGELRIYLNVPVAVVARVLIGCGGIMRGELPNGVGSEIKGLYLMPHEVHYIETGEKF